MVIAILQQVAGYMVVFGSHIERDAVSLCIPIGTPPIFFPGKAFGSDIESGIGAQVGLIQMKDIEPDPLLRFLVTFDGDITHFPDPCPGILLFCQQPLKSFLTCFRQGFPGRLDERIGLVVPAYSITCIFEQGDFLTLFRGAAVAVGNLEGFLDYFRFRGHGFPIQEHFVLHKGTGLEMRLHGMRFNEGLPLV